MLIAMEVGVLLKVIILSFVIYLAIPITFAVVTCYIFPFHVSFIFSYKAPTQKAKNRYNSCSNELLVQNRERIHFYDVQKYFQSRSKYFWTSNTQEEKHTFVVFHNNYMQVTVTTSD